MQASFREWLRARLDELDWSNADLERLSGVNSSNISRWMDPVRPRRPTPAKLKMIAGPLGASYDDLMKLCYPLSGELVTVGDSDDQARQAAMWAVVRDLPRVYWPAIIAALTAVTENLPRPSSIPVSDADTDRVSEPGDIDNRGISDIPPHLKPGYPVCLTRAAELVTGFKKSPIAVSA